MAYIPLKKMLASHPSLYKLVMAGSKRVSELLQGIQPLIKTNSKKLTTIALEEIAAGKVAFKPGEGAVDPATRKGDAS